MCLCLEITRPAPASARSKRPRRAPDEAVFTRFPSPFPPITPTPCQPPAERVQSHEQQRSALSINEKHFELARFAVLTERAARAFLERKAAEPNAGEWLMVCTPNREP